MLTLCFFRHSKKFFNSFFNKEVLIYPVAVCKQTRICRAVDWTCASQLQVGFEKEDIERFSVATLCQFQWRVFAKLQWQKREFVLLCFLAATSWGLLGFFFQFFNECYFYFLGGFRSLWLFMKIWVLCLRRRSAAFSKIKKNHILFNWSDLTRLSQRLPVWLNERVARGCASQVRRSH